jgi:peptidoglycan/xylan/chitin deacetylase (PgdA/CDA1 family)
MDAIKPPASLSLDLDNQWSYMKTHGDAGWESYPSYLDIVVPRVLNFLEERRTKITFMIVGQDAALAKNHAAIKSIAAAGHEIGNHSFKHEPWLHLYSPEEIEKELVLAEDALYSVTGRQPVGFRGPGFSISTTVLEILARRGYLYDGSTFPTYLGPLARAYYFMTARNLSLDEKAQREKLFGTFRDGLRTNDVYWWRKHDVQLLEMPVTTLPIFKFPIHTSYILYLSMFSTRLALFYFSTAMDICQATGIQPSILLHSLDFLGSDDNVKELEFFPAMRLRAARKMHVVSEVLRIMSERFTVLTMQEHALSVTETSRFPVLGLR